MSGSGRIVAALDNLGTELLVVRNVQFSLVVQKSVEFFPLEKVVNQSARAFLAKYFEGLGDFDFAIRAVSNFLFECRRFGKGSGSKCDEAIRIEDQLIPIILSIGDLKVCRTR
jgi:hypothetical protein